MFIVSANLFLKKRSKANICFLFEMTLAFCDFFLLTCKILHEIGVCAVCIWFHVRCMTVSRDCLEDRAPSHLEEMTRGIDGCIAVILTALQLLMILLYGAYSYFSTVVSEKYLSRRSLVTLLPVRVTNCDSFMLCEDAPMLT